MDINEIRRRVAWIRNLSGDAAIAHEFEDSLMLDFIRYVASSRFGTVSDMAAEVLESRDIEFARHCA